MWLTILRGEFMKRLLKLIIHQTLIIFLISFCFIQSVAKAETVINFSIISPISNSIQYDDLKVIISKPSSKYQVTEVRAKVEGRETTLTYSDNAYALNDESNPGWVGNLNLNGLSRGDKTVEVTVKDAFGNSVTNKTIFKHTQNPKLNVISPKDFDFVNGKLNINVEASDLAGEKCMIKAYISTYNYGGEKLFEAIDKINTQVDLSKYNGQSKYIRFEVSNETGGTNNILKKINIDSSSLLDIESKIDGEILDYKNNKILYRTVNNEIRIKDLQTSSEQLIFSNSKNLVRYGFLTPLGAMFVAQNIEPSYACDSLFEFKNGEISFQGRLNSSTSLKVSGNYAIWNGDLKSIDTTGIPSGHQLYLKDLATNNIIQISNEALNCENNVTTKGEVAFATATGWSGSGDTTFNYNTYKYYNGSTYKLSTDSSYFNVYPMTDGNITLYRKHRINQSEDYLILNVDGKEQLIATSISSEFSPGRDYTVNNGYVAYTNYVNGIKQIFLWKDGSSKQLTYFGTDSYIQSLSAQGYVVARINNGDYFIKNDGSQPIKLNILDGLKHYWVNNELFGAIGGSILKIETNIVSVVPVTGITLSNTELKLTKGQKAVLSVSISPTNGTNKNVIWTSNNANVATVDNLGRVTAEGEGLAEITVSTEDGKFKAICTVSVTVPVNEITLDKNELTLYKGATNKLVANVNPSDATNKNLRWWSSDKTVATVDNEGNVSAIKAGSATITVASADYNLKANCVVTVKLKATEVNLIEKIKNWSNKFVFYFVSLIRLIHKE